MKKRSLLLFVSVFTMVPALFSNAWAEIASGETRDVQHLTSTGYTDCSDMSAQKSIVAEDEFQGLLKESRSKASGTDVKP